MTQDVVEEMLAKGQLPNLAALKSRGGYSPLTPTVPAHFTGPETTVKAMLAAVLLLSAPGSVGVMTMG